MSDDVPSASANSSASSTPAAPPPPPADRPSDPPTDRPTDPRGETPTPPPTAFDPDPADDQPGTRTATLTDTRTGVAARDGGAGDGGFGDPIDTDFPTAPTKGGLTAALVSVGAGLLGAAVLIATMRGRQGADDAIDWSTYGVGLAATAALLLLGLVGAVAVRRRSGGQARGDLVTWPGVVGILATAPMIVLGLGPHHHGKGETYLVGGVITVLAVIGYILARRAAFVVVAIVGLALLYGQGFADTIGDSLHEKHVVVVAVGITAFVVIITVLGWFLPSRAVSGVAVGAAGALGLTGTMAVLFAEREIAGVLGSFGSMLPMIGSGKLSANPADYTDQVGWILAMVAVLTVLWALAALVSDHSGFKVLAVALPAVTVPLGTAVLAVQHPTWWEAALGAAGGVLVLAALLLARRRARAAEGM